MENYNLIKYKWQHGIYKIKDMIEFVNHKTLTKQQFFEITRYSYDGLKDIEINKNL